MVIISEYNGYHKGIYSGYHTRNMVAIICIGYSTEGYWEMWIVENAWLFVVQFKLRKEHL